jgi:hypothetical protein
MFRFKKPPNFFPEWLHQLAFPPAVYEGKAYECNLPKRIFSKLNKK